MAKGIEIGVASDTKAFKQGVETGIIDPLDNAIMALTDLGNSKGPEELERSLDEASDATERLKSETKSTADAIDQEFRSSYKSLKLAKAWTTPNPKLLAPPVRPRHPSTAPRSPSWTPSKR